MTDSGNDVALTIINYLLCIREVGNLRINILSHRKGIMKDGGGFFFSSWPLRAADSGAWCSRVHFLVTHRGNSVIGHGIVKFLPKLFTSLITRAFLTIFTRGVGLLVITRQSENIKDTDGNLGIDVGGEVRTWYVMLPGLCLFSSVTNSALLLFYSVTLLQIYECEWGVSWSFEVFRYCAWFALQCVLCLFTPERHVTAGNITNSGSCLHLHRNKSKDYTCVSLLIVYLGYKSCTLQES